MQEKQGVSNLKGLHFQARRKMSRNEDLCSKETPDQVSSAQLCLSETLDKHTCSNRNCTNSFPQTTNIWQQGTCLFDQAKGKDKARWTVALNVLWDVQVGSLSLLQIDCDKTVSTSTKAWSILHFLSHSNCLISEPQTPLPQSLSLPTFLKECDNASKQGVPAMCQVLFLSTDM